MSVLRQVIDWMRRTTQGLPAPTAPPLPRLGQLELRSPEMVQAARAITRGLTPERIEALFRAAVYSVADQVLLGAEIEEYDDHVAGTLELRRAAVLGLDVIVSAGDRRDRRSQQAAEQVRDVLGEPWMTALREHLLRSVLQQYAGAEIYWDTSRAGSWRPVGMYPIEPWRWHFARDARPLLLRRPQHLSDAIEPCAGKYCVMTYGALPGQPGSGAKVRSLALLWFIGRLGLVGWGEQVDAWFQPFTIFQYEAGAPESAIRRWLEEYSRMAKDRTAAVPAGTNVQVHDVPDQSPYAVFMDWNRRAISRALLGQDSAQMALEGQRTGATLQGSVRDDIRDRDARLLDAAINETLVRPWCAWNFGADVPPPRIETVIEVERDPEQTARVIEAGLRIGLRVPRGWAHAKLKIQEPEPDDEVLPPPAPTAPAWPTALARRAGGRVDLLGERLLDAAAAELSAAWRRRLAARLSGADSEAELRQALADDDDVQGGEPAELLALALTAAHAAGRVREFERRASSAARGAARPRSVLAAGDEAVVRRALEEAVEAFRRRDEVFTADEFERLSGAARERAFTVARVAEREAIERLRQSLDTAVAEGRGWREWLDEAGDVIREQGLTDNHARAIYQTNVMLAQRDGRVEQSAAAGAIAWRKLPSSSDVPDASHAQHDGRVFALSVPRPPWRHGCRCEWEPLFEGEFEGEPDTDVPAEVEL
ncbi:MAG: DUF935 domain-containing protein [Phycisphaerae bacterium]|nr:DUF935 family protein [Phycisphaerae bacterium]MCZ2398601.1 DUF935 domain-containing protein [Phycisphaerae bacterium]